MFSDKLQNQPWEDNIYPVSTPIPLSSHPRFYMDSLIENSCFSQAVVVHSDYHI